MSNNSALEQLITRATIRLNIVFWPIFANLGLDFVII
jgi:hypothetical protein